MTFEEWRVVCVEVIEAIGLSTEDLWAEDDPYYLHAEAKAAYGAGTTPDAFIQEVFSEDIAALEYNDHLREEGAKYEEDDADCDDLDEF